MAELCKDCMKPLKHWKDTDRCPKCNKKYYLSEEPDLSKNKHILKRMKEIGSPSKSKAGIFMTKIRQGEVSDEEIKKFLIKEMVLTGKAEVNK